MAIDDVTLAALVLGASIAVFLIMTLTILLVSNLRDRRARVLNLEHRGLCMVSQRGSAPLLCDSVLYGIETQLVRNGTELEKIEQSLRRVVGPTIDAASAASSTAFATSALALMELTRK